MTEVAQAQPPPALIPGWPPAWSVAILAIGAFAMVLGACLFLSVRASMVEQAARLQGAITVAVQADPRSLESADAAAARAAETLAALPQVARVKFLTPRPGDRRIAALLRLRRDAPVRLLSVDLHQAGGTIAAFTPDGYRLAVDDRRRHGPLEAGERRERAEAGLTTLAGLILLVVAAAGGAVARIRAASERVRLLSWLGASPARLVAAAAGPCWWVATAAIAAGVAAAAIITLRPGAGATLLVAPRSGTVILAAAATLLAGPIAAAVAFAGSSLALIRRLEAP